MRLLSAVLQTYESSPDFESEKEMTEFLFLGELFLLYIYIYIHTEQDQSLGVGGAVHTDMNQYRE